MKNALPSFPLNGRDVEFKFVAALLILLEVLSFVNTGWKEGQAAREVAKQTQLCLRLAGRIHFLRTHLSHVEFMFFFLTAYE